MTSQRQYDALGRLTGIQHARGTETLASVAYTLDAVGKRLQAVETAGRAGDDRDGRTSRGVTLDYRYDALDRLLGVQSTDPVAVSERAGSDQPVSITFIPPGTSIRSGTGGGVTRWEWSPPGTVNLSRRAAQSSSFMRMRFAERQRNQRRVKCSAW